MTSVVGAGLPDATHLRIAIAEMRGLHSLLTQFADVAAEMPDIDLERVAGIHASARLVARQLVQRESRLAQVTGTRTRRDVVVFDPSRGSWVELPDGQSLLPMAMAPRAGGLGLCSGVARLAPGVRSQVRVYHDSDVVMIVLFGSAITIWWNADGMMWEARQLRHQHVHIPQGTPHCVYNPGAVPMLAVVAHSGATLTEMELLPDLDEEVAAVRRAV